MRLISINRMVRLPSKTSMFFHIRVVRKVGSEADSWRKGWKGSGSWRVWSGFWGRAWLKALGGRRAFHDQGSPSSGFSMVAGVMVFPWGMDSMGMSI